MNAPVQKEQFLTPVGRLVQGDPFEKQTKNMQGQPLMTQAGQPTQRYFIAVAFAKTDAAFGAFYQQLVKVARQSFPTLFDAAGNCTHPRFSWKLIDGDGVDDNGKSNKTKDGFAGHWVVKFQSSFPPKCFHKDHYQPHEQIQDPNAIRRGYYVRVSGTIEGNANPQKPGLYVNLSMVELAAHGVEIVSGPDASAVFGGTPAPSMPQGAVALPGTPAMPSFPGAGVAMPPPVAPVAPVAPQPPMMPGAQPAMPGLPGSFPGGAAPAMPPPMAPGAVPAGVAPQLPVMPNAGFPAGPGMPQPPAPPVGPQLTAAALAQAPGMTFAQWQAMGWTEPAMRQAGYIV